MNEDKTLYTSGYCSTNEISGIDTAASITTTTTSNNTYTTGTGSSIYSYGNGYISRYYDLDTAFGIDFGDNINIDGKLKRVQYKTLEECKKSFDQEGFDILPLNQDLDISMWVSLGIIELSPTIPSLNKLFITLYSDDSEKSTKLFTYPEPYKIIFHLKTNSSVYLSEFNLVIISLRRKIDRDEVLILVDENTPEIYKINKEEIIEHLHSAINNSSYITEIIEDDTTDYLKKVWYNTQGISSSGYSPVNKISTNNIVSSDQLLKTYKDMLSNNLLNSYGELGHLSNDIMPSSDD